MAVKKRKDMDFSDKKFMVILSGQPGLGKTTLALSAPKPFLLDFDRGVARVRAEHSEDVDVSECETYEEVLKDMESQAYKDCETVVIDTGGSLVQLMKPWARSQDAKSAKDGRAMYGTIKTEFDRLVYQIRNTDQKNLVVVFHTTEQSQDDIIQTRLSCEGSTKDIIWTPADFGGHMFMMGNRRMIGFSPTDTYFAKGCFGVSGVMQIPELAPGQPNTFLTDLFAAARQKIGEEARVYGAEKDRYDAALEAVMPLIEAVSDPESAAAAQAAIQDAEHALTSEAELKAAFKKRLKQAGLKYDAKAQAYVSA